MCNLRESSKGQDLLPFLCRCAKICASVPIHFTLTRGNCSTDISKVNKRKIYIIWEEIMFVTNYHFSVLGIYPFVIKTIHCVKVTQYVQVKTFENLDLLIGFHSVNPQKFTNFATDNHTNACVYTIQCRKIYTYIFIYCLFICARNNTKWSRKRGRNYEIICKIVIRDETLLRDEEIRMSMQFLASNFLLGEKRYSLFCSREWYTTSAESRSTRSYIRWLGELDGRVVIPFTPFFSSPPLFFSRFNSHHVDEVGNYSACGVQEQNPYSTWFPRLLETSTSSPRLYTCKPKSISRSKYKETFSVAPITRFYRVPYEKANPIPVALQRTAQINRPTRDKSRVEIILRTLSRCAGPGEDMKISRCNFSE